MFIPAKPFFLIPSRYWKVLNSCAYYNFDFEVIDDIYKDLEFEHKDAYITIQKSHLVELIQQIRDKKLTMGKDIGVISYNETPLKALLGITIISTDFLAIYLPEKKRSLKMTRI